MAVGRINRVAALTGFYYKKMYGHFAGTKKSGRINEVAVRRGSTVYYSQNPNWNSYGTSKPPYLVLNILESHAGFKVVAANSVNDATGTYQIWTLHSLKPSKETVRLAAQEQPENRANYAQFF